MNYSELFYYDITSPTCLRWNTWNKQRSHQFRRDMHDIAGYLDSTTRDKEFYKVGAQNRFHKVHRIIWILHNGEIPADLVIDHVDGDSLNNKIENLRVVTQKVNCQNSSTRSDNKSGVCGVTFTIKNGKELCRAYVTVNGKQKSKAFSVNKYGSKVAFELACNWRSDQIKLLNSQGASYSDRHGT